MAVLVVLGHPRKGSFCHALAALVCEELKNSGKEVIYHDLSDENFDPLLPAEELPTSAPLPPEIEKYCLEVEEAEGYVIIHPNWWAQPPAILKGWVDRAIRQGRSYRFGPNGLEGLLKGKKALVFTTSNTPREDELRLYGDPLENLWKTCVFGFCGVDDFKRRNFESVILSTPQQRATWLEEARQLLRERFKLT